MGKKIATEELEFLMQAVEEEKLNSMTFVHQDGAIKLAVSSAVSISGDLLVQLIEEILQARSKGGFMKKIYITSDQHFGHSNIIQYENRPFFNVESMTRELTREWNKVVRKQDEVWVLGDFSFYGKEKTLSILSALNGTKYLVKGNHDHPKSNNWWRGVGFKEIYDKPILYKSNIIFSHEPVANLQSDYFNLHGHIHSTPSSAANGFNVSVERNNYKPFDLESIIAKFNIYKLG